MPRNVGSPPPIPEPEPMQDIGAARAMQGDMYNSIHTTNRILRMLKLSIFSADVEGIDLATDVSPIDTILSAYRLKHELVDHHSGRISAAEHLAIDFIQKELNPFLMVWHHVYFQPNHQTLLGGVGTAADVCIPRGTPLPTNKNFGDAIGELREAVFGLINELELKANPSQEEREAFRREMGISTPAVNTPPPANEPGTIEQRQGVQNE